MKANFCLPFALLLAGAPAWAASSERTFHEPQIEGYPLDGCLYWASDCGQPAADAFCRMQGFDAAFSFQMIDNIRDTTKVLGDGSICVTSSEVACGTFSAITCGYGS